VAGAANCRKSTAINIGARLLRGIPSTKIIGGKITPEQFITELAESVSPVDPANPIVVKAPPIFVHSPELSVFLTKSSYGESMIHNLTDLYDCPEEWQYKTKNAGKHLLKDVFICILSATTPEGMASGIPVTALKDGFASRVLFVYQ